jgi:hypothetical protein
MIKKGTCNTTVLTTTVLKYPKFLHQTMTDSTIIEHSRFGFTTQCTYFYFDRYGKLLKVLLQLPLAGTEDIMVRIYHHDYWFIVNYDLTEKTKFSNLTLV